METSDNNLSPKQREFADFLEKASKQESKVDKDSLKETEGKFEEVIHPNSLITKNISLFSKNPNYKLLTWLIVQLLIFSIFIFSVTLFKKYLIPYLNGI